MYTRNKSTEAPAKEENMSTLDKAIATEPIANFSINFNLII